MAEPYMGRACVLATPCFLLGKNFLEGLCHDWRQSTRFTDPVPSLTTKNFLEGLCHDWLSITRFTDSAPSLICLGHKFIFFS